MNRQGVGPQSLRGLPSGFPNQQQIPQNRSVSTRLPPSAKMASNGTTWAFGGGIPMGNVGLGNPRSNNPPMTSFAQTIGGSQPTAQLDLSEFPSLSNNQAQQSLSSNQPSWATAGTRNVASASGMRLQQSVNLSSQPQINPQQSQQQQDEMFHSSSHMSNSQLNFRFGGQSVNNQSQSSNAADEFPPLSRNVIGDIGHDRSNLVRNVGFGSQGNGVGFSGPTLSQSNRGNGLLNALSGSNRTAPSNRVASPASISGVSVSRSPADMSRQGLGGNDASASFLIAPSTSSVSIPQREDNLPQSASGSGLRGEIDPSILRSQTQDSVDDNNTEEAKPKVQDPLSQMSDIDKWGLKGFSLMMNSFPDYAYLVTGSDITNLGFDLNSTESFSTQIYSLWDNEPSRPGVPQYSLPECYSVHNVAALETKISNFNDEALIFMFYSNPGDIQQTLAAQELHNRNWRYHKKLQLWLTKDDIMVPQALGNGTERGFYIFFDVKQWQRERREFTLVYDDLENLPNGPRI